MHIRVNTISGRTETVEADTVEELQLAIEQTMGVPVEEQKLLCNGKIVSADNLSESVQLIVCLDGGAKGKKKKQTKAKTKKPHKHQNIKLRVLNMYKVDGEKVARLKRQCDVCPPGTFLADHEDRLYCGRCRTTYAKVVDKSKKQAPKKKEKKVEKKVVEEAPKKGGKKGKK